MKMKKFIFLLLIFCTFSAYSQIQIVKVTRGEDAIRSLPRISIDLGIPVNIMGPYSIIQNTAAYIESGLFMSNNGYIFEEDGLRYVHRTFGVNVPVRGGKIIKEKYYLGAGHNFNFPIHYKLRSYDAGTRKNKQVVHSEFLSKRVSKFYPSMELSAGVMLHGIGRFSGRFQMYYMSFLNPAYTDNGASPYADLLFERQLRFVISYNPGL